METIFSDWGARRRRYMSNNEKNFQMVANVLLDRKGSGSSYRKFILSVQHNTKRNNNVGGHSRMKKFQFRSWWRWWFSRVAHLDVYSHYCVPGRYLTRSSCLLVFLCFWLSHWTKKSCLSLLLAAHFQHFFLILLQKTNYLSFVPSNSTSSLCRRAHDRPS